jgi:Lon protease-like protein
MPINLHIFEDRYKEMMSLCIDTRQPFGVVLIRQGEEALGPLAEPHPIGCTAQITQVERLAEGRMNIIAVGLERFQILALNHEKPYLVGRVKLLPFGSADAHTMEQAGQQLRPWVERYLAVLSRVLDNEEFDATRLPDDPLALAYLAAAVVQIPAAQKQTLLATDQAAEFISDIRTVYRREVALLKAMVARDKPGDFGQFSMN